MALQGMTKWELAALKLRIEEKAAILPKMQQSTAGAVAVEEPRDENTSPNLTQFRCMDCGAHHVGFYHDPRSRWIRSNTSATLIAIIIRLVMGLVFAVMGSLKSP